MAWLIFVCFDKRNKCSLTSSPENNSRVEMIGDCYAPKYGIDGIVIDQGPYEVADVGSLTVPSFSSAPWTAELPGTEFKAGV